MTRIVTQLLEFRSLPGDENGATAIEYALLTLFIAIVIVGAVTLVGGNLSTIFANLDPQI